MAGHMGGGGGAIPSVGRCHARVGCDQNCALKEDSLMHSRQAILGSAPLATAELRTELQDFLRLNFEVDVDRNCHLATPKRGYCVKTINDDTRVAPGPGSPSRAVFRPMGWRLSCPLLAS